MAKKKRSITTKRVQATENDPPPKIIPNVTVKPEQDDGEWDDDGLTIRQRAFVAALVGPAGGNATAAARMAGYRDDNADALKVTASENLTKPNVQEAIARALAKRRMSPEWAKESLVDCSRASMANFVTVDADGSSKLDFLKAVANGAMGQIKEYHEEVLKVGDSEISTIKRTIKVHDRTKALGMLLKFHKLIDGDDDDTPDKTIKVRRVKRSDAKS